MTSGQLLFLMVFWLLSFGLTCLLLVQFFAVKGLLVVLGSIMVATVLSNGVRGRLG